MWRIWRLLTIGGPQILPFDSHREDLSILGYNLVEGKPCRFIKKVYNRFICSRSTCRKASNGVIFMERQICAHRASSKKAFVFVDGQNLFHAAREAFGYRYPNYDVLKLAELICRKQKWQLECTTFIRVFLIQLIIPLESFLDSKIFKHGAQRRSNIFEDATISKSIHNSAGRLNLYNACRPRKGD